MMRPLLIALLQLTVTSACVLPCAAASSGSRDIARWQAEAGNVTIYRDNWGIAHVYGKTDADAVFGMEYAQAEDDFNRVESNYIDALGWHSQADGESSIYLDLRSQLFVDPQAVRAQYAHSPAWLKKLMNAFADGLNYYLYTHPEVRPRVITHFEPWMALAFSEGSIGGDIERGSGRSAAGSILWRAAGSVRAGRRRRAAAARVSGLERYRHFARRSPWITTRCFGSTRTPRFTSAPSCRW